MKRPGEVEIKRIESVGGTVKITWKPCFNEYGSPNDIVLKSFYNGKNFTTIPQHKYTSWTIDEVKVPSTVTFQLQAIASDGKKGPITYASHTTSGELIACVNLHVLSCVKEKGNPWRAMSIGIYKQISRPEVIAFVSGSIMGCRPFPS